MKDSTSPVSSSRRSEAQRSDIRLLQRMPMNISILYVGVALLWILVSDQFALLMFRDPTVLALVQTGKGFAFVLVTGAGLYWLLWRASRQALTAHRMLADSEASYRRLFENNPNPMWVAARDDLSLLDANAAAQRLYGYNHSEMRQMRLADLEARGEAGASWLAAGKDAGEHPARRFRHRRRDGSELLVELSAHPLGFGAREAWLLLALDVTERDRAERAAQENRQRLQLASRLGGLGYWELDLLSRGVYWSEMMFQLFAVPRSGWGGSLQGFLAAVHPDDRRHVSEAIDAAGRGEPLEFQHRLPDGERWLLHRGELVRSPAGKPERIVSIVQDITRLRRG